MPKVKTVSIDPVKLSALAEKHGGNAALSELIGRNKYYIRDCIKQEKMGETPFLFLQRTLELPDNALLPDPPKPSLPTVDVLSIDVVPAQRATPKPNRRACYWLDLADNGNHVVLRLMYGDDELFRAAAKVKGGEGADELNFIQAVSYAAHMLYKLAEQKDLTSE